MRLQDGLAEHGREAANGVLRNLRRGARAALDLMLPPEGFDVHPGAQIGNFH